MDNTEFQSRYCAIAQKQSLYLPGVLLMILLTLSSNAFSRTLNFTGTLDNIFVDTGAAVYSGTPLGSEFSGFIDDTNGSGQITDGTTITRFACCSATSVAEGLDIANDVQLESEEAALLNNILGTATFFTGDIIDSVNIEGESTTAAGGRIEVGLSYILKSSAFSDEQPSNYPFNPDDVVLELFFILEEDASEDADVFDAVGLVTMTEIITPAQPTGTPGELLPRDLDGDVTSAEAYYDTDLDITWLKDANLALSNTFEVPDIRADGLMNFSTAQFWINTMNSASYLGHTSWRVPTILPVGGGSAFNTTQSNNATADVGTAVTGLGWVDPTGAAVSEMGNLYYVTLGNRGFFTPNGNNLSTSVIEQPGFGLANMGPFENIESDKEDFNGSWSAMTDSHTAFNLPAGASWSFSFGQGFQGYGSTQTLRRVWPVHDGDIGSPLEVSPIVEPEPPVNSDQPAPGDTPPDSPTDESPAEDPVQNTGSSGGGTLSLWMLLIGVVRLRSLHPSIKRTHNG